MECAAIGTILRLCLEHPVNEWRSVGHGHSNVEDISGRGRGQERLSDLIVTTSLDYGHRVAGFRQTHSNGVARSSTAHYDVVVCSCDPNCTSERTESGINETLAAADVAEKVS